MQIKRFEAKNMTEALRQIKRTLGPEAVILSAKDRRKENRLLGLSRKIGVEVTAAVDEDYPGVRDDRQGIERSNSGQGVRYQSKTRPAAKAGVRGEKGPMEDIVRLNGGKSSRLASQLYRHHGKFAITGLSWKIILRVSRHLSQGRHHHTPGMMK